MPLLFLLLIFMHVSNYAADNQFPTFPSTVTITKIDGQDHITYKRISSEISSLAAMISTSKVLNHLPDHLLYDSVNITFPTKLLLQSKTLRDLLNEDPDIVRKGTYQQSLTLATQWLLDDKDLKDIPLIIDTLKAYSASKDLQNTIIIPRLLQALTNSQINLLVQLAEFFDINGLSEGLACHLAQKPERLATVADAPPYLEKLTKSKIDFRSLGTLLYEKRKSTVTTFKSQSHNHKFSPDGTKKIIRCSLNSNYIAVFDAQSGKLIFEGEGTANHAKNIIYGKDKDSVAWGFHFLDKTQFFPIARNNPFDYLKISPDGKTFAAKSNRSDPISLYNLDQYVQQNTILLPYARIILEISPNNHLCHNNLNFKISYSKHSSEFLVYSGRTCTVFDAQSLQILGFIDTDAPIIKASYTDEGKIKIKTDPRSIHDLDRPPCTHLYEHINFTTLPLEHIGTLYEVAQHWQQHKKPYTIYNAETLQRLSETIPELMVKSKLFSLTDKSKKVLLNNLQTDLVQSIGDRMQHFDLQDTDLRWIKLLQKANSYWKNKEKYSLTAKQFELLLTKNVPLEVIIELFGMTNIYNDLPLVIQKNLVNNFLKQQ